MSKFLYLFSVQLLSSTQCCFIGINCVLTCCFVFYYWVWVFFCSIFWNPFFNVFEIGIKLFLLTCGIKNSKIKLRIHTRGSSPLPTSSITCHFVIKELFGEIGYPKSPVNHQVFSKKTSNNHSYAIVHKSCCI